MNLLLFSACLSVLAAAGPLPFSGQTVLEVDPVQQMGSIIKALEDAEVIPDVLPFFVPTVSLEPIYVNASQPVVLGNTIPVSATASMPAFAIKDLASWGEPPAAAPGTQGFEVAPGPLVRPSPPSANHPTRTFSTNVSLTLVLSDPDATSRSDPVKGQMCHWIATGISAGPYYRIGAALGETSFLDLRGVEFTAVYSVREPGPQRYSSLVQYMQPAPPPRTGKHRYVFVLLAPDPEADTPRTPERPSERPHFGYGEMGRGVMDWAKDNGLLPIGANFFYAQDEKQ